jgi:hypothetical protein
MTDILRLGFDERGLLVATASIWLLLVALILVGLFLLMPWLRTLMFKQEFEVDQIELGIGNSTVVLKPNSDDLQVAYRLWVELRTRKLGLPFDEEHDVIVEVYNSWYEFFRITRELMKSIPVSKIRGQESTQLLVKISVDILNKTIRPHLTKWQARFRRWYDQEAQKQENIGLDSQKVQRKYPEYASLVGELIETNSHLVAYGNLLSQIIGLDVDQRPKR